MSIYPKEFFKLQYDFAHTMSEKTGISIYDSLLRYTFFPKRIGVLSKPADGSDPKWLDYVSAVADGVDPVEEAYTRHKTVEENRNSNKYGDVLFGNFRYDVKGTTVHLHFVADFQSKVGPLKRERYSEQFEHVGNMFQQIHERYPGAQEVQCTSWLFNLDGWTRLYPKEFSQNSEIANHKFNSSSLWGQFIRSDGSLNLERAQAFRDRFKDLDPSNPCEIFPFQNFMNTSPIGSFYSFYEIN